MGYYTEYTLTAKLPKTPLVHPAKVAVEEVLRAAGINVKGKDKSEMTLKSQELLDKVFVAVEPFLRKEEGIYDQITRKLTELSEYTFDDHGGEWNLNGKWYEHEDNMKQLSAAFPTVTFLLEGHGEESGDVWRKEFLGGKMLKSQKAKLVFE